MAEKTQFEPPRFRIVYLALPRAFKGTVV